MANLTKARLYRVDLKYTNLIAANLTEVSLGKADLKGANLSGANLTKANLDGAVLCHTTMPDATENNSGCTKEVR